MIINEGFIENAKKIASTQSKNEVNVPVIRRENWEYKISIWYDSTSKKILNLFNNEFIKEHSEIYTEIQNGNQCYYETKTDVFSTIESLYNFMKFVYSSVSRKEGDKHISIYMLFSNENKEDLFIKLYNSNNKSFDFSCIFNYPMDSDEESKPNFFDVCMFFGISVFKIERWLFFNNIDYVYGSFFYKYSNAIKVDDIFSRENICEHAYLNYISVSNLYKSNGLYKNDCSSISIRDESLKYDIINEMRKRKVDTFILNYNKYINDEYYTVLISPFEFRIKIDGKFSEVYMVIEIYDKPEISDMLDSITKIKKGKYMFTVGEHMLCKVNNSNIYNMKQSDLDLIEEYIK